MSLSEIKTNANIRYWQSKILKYKGRTSKWSQSLKSQFVIYSKYYMLKFLSGTFIF